MGVLGRVRSWLSAVFADPDEDGLDEELENGDTAASIPARAVRPLESLICTPRDYKDARYAVQSLTKAGWSSSASWRWMRRWASAFSIS